jgi:hypothetical protein
MTGSANCDIVSKARRDSCGATWTGVFMISIYLDLKSTIRNPQSKIPSFFGTICADLIGNSHDEISGLEKTIGCNSVVSIRNY